MPWAKKEIRMNSCAEKIFRFAFGLTFKLSLKVFLNNYPKQLTRHAKLKCRYIHYAPALFIAPVKEEQVFDDPPIWVYHNVITEKQIETMKQLAKPKVFILFKKKYS